MSVVSIEIPADFNWDTEEGQYLNLMLNMAGGLEEVHLTDDERALIARVRSRYENKQTGIIEMAGVAE